MDAKLDRNDYISRLDPNRLEYSLSSKTLEELEKISENKSNELKPITREQYKELRNSKKSTSIPTNIKEINDSMRRLYFKEQELKRWEENLIKREKNLKSGDEDDEDDEDEDKDNEHIKKEENVTPQNCRSLSYSPFNYTPGGVINSNVSQDVKPTSPVVEVSNDNYLYDEELAIQNATRQSEQDALDAMDSAQEKLLKQENEKEEINKEELKISVYKTVGRPVGFTDDNIKEFIEFINNNNNADIKKYMVNFNTNVTQWIINLTYEDTKFRQLLLSNSDDIDKCFIK